MGPGEIRKYLGVTRQRVYQLTRRADFPEPVAILEMGNVWAAKDVKAWDRRRPKRRDFA